MFSNDTYNTISVNMSKKRGNDVADGSYYDQEQFESFALSYMIDENCTPVLTKFRNANGNHLMAALKKARSHKCQTYVDRKHLTSLMLITDFIACACQSSLYNTFHKLKPKFMQHIYDILLRDWKELTEIIFLFSEESLPDYELKAIQNFLTEMNGRISADYPFKMYFDQISSMFGEYYVGINSTPAPVAKNLHYILHKNDAPEKRMQSSVMEKKEKTDFYAFPYGDEEEFPIVKKQRSDSTKLEKVSSAPVAKDDRSPLKDVKNEVKDTVAAPNIKIVKNAFDILMRRSKK